MPIEYRCSKCGDMFARLDAAKKHDAQHKAKDKELAKKKLLIKNLIKKALPEKIEGFNTEYIKQYATNIFSYFGVDLDFSSSKDLRAASLSYDVYLNADSVSANIKKETPYILNNKLIEKFKTKDDCHLVFYAKKIFLDNNKSFLSYYIESICDEISYAGFGYRIRMNSARGNIYHMSFNLSVDSFKEIEALRLERKTLGEAVSKNRRSTLHEMQNKYCEYFKLNATCDANIISLFLENKQIAEKIKDLNARKEEVSTQIKNFGRDLYGEFSSSNDIEAFAVKSGLDIESLEKYNDICNKTNELTKSISKISNIEVKEFALNMSGICMNDTTWLP